MNRSPTAPPLLAVRLRPSMRLAILLGLAHLAAIGLLWPLTLPVAATTGLSLLIAGSLAFHLRHHALLRSPASVTGLAFSREMACTLELRDGRRIACSVLDATFVSSYLTVLELRMIAPESGAPGCSTLRALPASLFRGRSVTILPDAIDAEAFRGCACCCGGSGKAPPAQTMGDIPQAVRSEEISSRYPCKTL